MEEEEEYKMGKGWSAWHWLLWRGVWRRIGVRKEAEVDNYSV
jgi:hypothetical protein